MKDYRNLAKINDSIDFDDDDQGPDREKVKSVIFAKNGSDRLSTLEKSDSQEPLVNTAKNSSNKKIRLGSELVDSEGNLISSVNSNQCFE